MSTHVNSIFVSNNGLTDHIGIAQVVPYVTGLAMRGHQLRTISVERSEQMEAAGIQVLAGLHQAGVTTEIQTHKGGLLGIWERRRTLVAALERLIRESRPDLLHCRSYMPLAAVMRAARKHKIPFVFDMRGFWIDQRIEGRVWRPTNLFHRAVIGYFRRLEARALNQAAAIVVLTEDAKQIVLAKPGYAGAPIYVVPCSVELTKFDWDQRARDVTRRELGVAENDILLVYAGSAGSVYRIDQTFRVHARASRMGLRAKLLFLGKHDPSKLLELGRVYSPGLKQDDLFVKMVPHHEVTNYFSASDFGVCFLVTSYSSLGVSATKVGEYLCCGLPVLTNSGIGDIHEIISNQENGFVLEDFTDSSIESLVEAIPTLMNADRCAIRDKARLKYDLRSAIDVYDVMYRALKP